MVSARADAFLGHFPVTILVVAAALSAGCFRLLTSTAGQDGGIDDDSIDGATADGDAREGSHDATNELGKDTALDAEGDAAVVIDGDDNNDADESSLDATADADGFVINSEPLRIAAGASHTCIILDSGDLRCWGLASFGQLGGGNTEDIGDDELPSEVEPISFGSTVIEVTAGNYHTCALLEGGELRCWGYGLYGQLGNGDTTNIGDDELPSELEAVSLDRTVLRVSSGNHHNCVLLEGGELRCWGLGAQGQLGYGDTEDLGDDELPSEIGPVSVGGAVAQVSSGESHTCALLVNGDLRCWGSGGFGRLGYGNTNNIGDDELPSEVGDVALGGRVIQLDAAMMHTCALLEVGGLLCWGANANGQLGYGSVETIGDDEPPVSQGIIYPGGTVAQVVTGHFHTCALLETGDLRCWGAGEYGQLGYGNINNVGDDELPSDMEPVSYE